MWISFAADKFPLFFIAFDFIVKIMFGSFMIDINLYSIQSLEKERKRRFYIFVLVVS